MKKIWQLMIIFISLTLSVMFVAGCAFTTSPVQGLLVTDVSIPVTYQSAKQNSDYQAIGYVQGRSKATSVLGIVAAGDASVNAAYHDAMIKAPEAEGLIDVCVDQKYNSVLGLYASYTTMLNARAVKWIKKPQGESVAFSSGTFPSNSGFYDNYASPSSGFNLFSDAITGHSAAFSLSNLAGEPGGAGLKFGYKFRKIGSYSFNAAVSYGTVKYKDGSDFQGYIYEDNEWGWQTAKLVNIHVDIDGGYHVIPIELNFAISSDAFPGAAGALPHQLKPNLEAGLTYYMWQAFAHYSSASPYAQNSSYDYEGSWDYFEMGLNLGLGLDYYLKSNLSLSAGVKRYIVFDKDFDFWNWEIGITLMP